MALPGTLHVDLRDDAIRHLTAGTSVDLQGPPGSGCSLLARAICDEMQDLGWQVVRCQGIAALQDRPLEALSIAGLVARQGGPNGPNTPISAAVQGLLAAMKGSATLLAIDDVEELDEMSAGAISAAHAMSPFPILSTSHPTPRPVRPAGLVTAAIRPGVEILVPPLGFVDTQTLVSELLGAPIDATSFARIFAASGGLPSITQQIVDSARLHGTLRLENGVWSVKSELWLPEMDRAVEPLLHHLTPEAIDGLHALALAGTIDIKTARKFVDWPVLEELDGYKLLQFVTRGDEILVSVFPQAIVEFFRHHSVGARQLRVDAAVTSAFGEDSEFHPHATPTGWGAGLPGDASSLHLVNANVDNADLVENRLLLDHWHREMLVRRSEWEQNPTPRTAAALIRTMLITGADAAAIARVREQTPRTGNHRDLASFDNWYALYAGMVERDAASMRDVFDASRLDADEWSGLTEAIEDFIIMETEYCPDPSDLEAAPDDAPADTKEVNHAVRAELFLTRGNPTEALAELEQVGEPRTEFARSRKATVPWALLLENDVTEAEAQAKDALAKARHEHDIEGIVGAAYVLAVAYTLRGHTTELRDLLGSVLSTGILPALQRPQHVALLSIAAALAASEGRPTTARSLAQQAVTLQTGPGPVPLGSPTQAIAELDLADQPPSQAKIAIANRLWTEAEELLDKQYLLAGYICGVLAYVANPEHDRAVRLAEVSALMPAPLIRQFELLVSALDDGSPEALVAAGNKLADAGQVWAATAAYTAGLAALRAAGNSAEAAIVHNEARQRLDVWGPEAAAGLRSAAEGAELTAREDEIARLAATGLSNQEIARRLLISVRTVENHLHRVFRKLGVDNRAGMSRALAG